MCNVFVKSMLVKSDFISKLVIKNDVLNSKMFNLLKMFVNDVFLLFGSKDHLEKFRTVSVNNIKTENLYFKLRKVAPCHF